MTKTLQEIQEFNRKKIICAVNGTENYEEALKLEYDKKGNNTISVPIREYEGEDLTLDRVLLALSRICGETIISTYEDLFSIKKDKYSDYIDFELTKPTLEEQSEETQRAIYELLRGENE
jgi:hypothetical protein